jgi:hypothetical protein
MAAKSRQAAPDGPRMVTMRVLRGTVVAGGQDHGPGAAVDIPEAEASGLAALGVCAFVAAAAEAGGGEAAEGAKPVVPSAEWYNGVQEEVTSRIASDEAGDPTAA